MMAWLSSISAIFVIVGLGLFLYGVNIYHAVIGWSGFCLGVAGILLYVIPFLYVQINKKKFEQTPV
jgi:Flp pilus assembly protein TadB